MKFTNVFKFLFIVLAVVIGFSMTGCDLYEEELDELVGFWEGTYYDGGGMTLDVYKERNNYKAVFSFSWPGSANGSYRMNVTYTGGEYVLKYEQWITNPYGWVSVDFKGKLNGNVFSGDIYHTGKLDGKFSVVRK